jgi:hypothetical protein
MLVFTCLYSSKNGQLVAQLDLGPIEMHKTADHVSITILLFHSWFLRTVTVLWDAA